MLASAAMPLVQVPCGRFAFVLGLGGGQLASTLSKECLEFINVVCGERNVIVALGACGV